MNMHATQPSAETMHRLPPTGFIRQDFLLKLIPWSKSTLWVRIAAGQFPKPISLGPRMVAWRVENVLSYIRSPVDWEAGSRHESDESVILVGDASGRSHSFSQLKTGGSK